MSRTMLQFEERFLEGLEEVQLPMTLNVIYQEGIRGNHILFDANDVAKFERMDLDSRCLKSRAKQTELEEKFVELMSLNRVSEMQNLIHASDFTMRRKIFSVYLRFLSQWSQHLKKSLN